MFNSQEVAMDEQKTILKISLAYLDILGFSPLKNLRVIQVFFVLAVFWIMFVLVYLRVLHEELSFSLISDTIESSFTMIHILSKATVLVIKHSIFKRILTKTERFWYFGNKETNFEKTLHNLKLFVTIFLAFVASTAIIFALRTMFDGSLTIKCYVPRFTPKTIFAIFDNMIFFLGAFCVGSFDAFVGSMIMLLYLQFKTLNEFILRMNFHEIYTENDVRTCLKKMKVCIDYHNFLYEVLEELTSVVSIVFLIHFTLAPITICFELFFILMSSKIMEIATSCFYLFGIVTELLFFYCIPATYLANESAKAINVIYNAKWQNCKFTQIRKYIVIIMQRMQKPATLSAGKMFAVNLETCTQIFKMGLSFYTFLRMIDERRAQILGS